METEKSTPSLTGLGAASSGTLNDAVANLSVATDILKQGLDAGIERSSNKDNTDTDSEVGTPLFTSFENVTVKPTPVITVNAPATPVAITVTSSEVVYTRDSPALGRATTPVNSVKNLPPGSDHNTDDLPTEVQINLVGSGPGLQNSNPANPPTSTPDSGLNQSPRMRGLANNHNKPADPPATPSSSTSLTDSFPPPSGTITYGVGTKDNLPINNNSTLDSTFDGFITMTDGTRGPYKITPTPPYTTSTPRPLPGPTLHIDSPQVYPNALAIEFDPQHSRIPSHPDTPTPTPLPQRGAKRKLIARRSSKPTQGPPKNGPVDQDVIVITQTIPSNSSSDEDTILPGPGFMDPMIHKATETSPSLDQPMTLATPSGPTPSSSAQELSRLIELMTTIGHIGQEETAPPETHATDAKEQNLSDSTDNLNPFAMDINEAPLSRASSPKWPAPEDASSSWFDNIVASHAADNSLILVPKPATDIVPPRKIKISPAAPSDDNLKIVRGFHQGPTMSNSRSVSLPQGEGTQKPQQEKLQLPFLIEKEWRGARARLIQGNKTKARAVHLSELSQVDPITGDPPVATLWAMGLEPLPDFVLEDDKLTEMVAEHRRDAAISLQSKVAIALNDRAEGQLKLAHTTLAQTQSFAEADNVTDFPKALDVLAKMVGREKAQLKSQLRKKRPALKLKQPTTRDWINFHSFSSSIARSQAKSTPVSATRKPDKKQSNPVPRNPPGQGTSGFRIPRTNGNPPIPTTSGPWKSTPNQETPRDIDRRQPAPSGRPPKKPNRKRDRSKSNTRNPGSPPQRLPFKTNAPTAPSQSMQMIMNQMANLPFLIPNPFMFGQHNQPGLGYPTDFQQGQNLPAKKWKKNRNKNKNQQKPTVKKN